MFLPDCMILDMYKASLAGTVFWEVGAAGGAMGGFVGGAGNAWLGGASFGQGLKAGGIAGGIGGAAGGLLGGLARGIDAATGKSKAGFWNGILKPGSASSVNLYSRMPEVPGLQTPSLTSRSVPMLQAPEVPKMMSVSNPIPEVTVYGTATRSGFDISAAVSALNAAAGVASQSACAAYVRRAVQAGGVDTSNRPPAPHSAKDYGPYIEKWGFDPINTADYQMGDIAVFQNAPGHPHGHMQMYNGNQWVSDYYQNSFWPSTNYKTAPNFQIFRWK